MEEMDSALDLKEYMGIEYEDGQRKQHKIGDGTRSMYTGHKEWPHVAQD